MVETRRSSDPSKRPLSSPLPPSERSKASTEISSSMDDKLNSGPKATESREPEGRSSNLSSPGSPKPSDSATGVKVESQQPEVVEEPQPVGSDIYQETLVKALKLRVRFHHSYIPRSEKEWMQRNKKSNEK